MAVPKRKVSKQSGNSRFANWKIKAPNLSSCSQCHELIESHTVCPNCGYYNGIKVVEKKVKEKK
ncbi:MAG: 50S ribosomal protein L32 [Christensenellaceae bacterium]|jgi:large subunit ribosomal protein L32|nr:50S ribosomal protein L32 [Christensenellaceae bacterium]